MRSVNRLVVLSGLAALIASSCQVSMAADSTDKKSAPAAKKGTKHVLVKAKDIPVELKDSHERGLKITATPLVPTKPTNPVTPVKVVPKTTTPKTLTQYVKQIHQNPGTQPRGLNVVAVPLIPHIARPQANPQNHKRIATPVIASKPATNTSSTKPESSDIVKVSNNSTPFINAWLDRAGTTPKYKVGDKMVINVSSSVDCNLVVYNYDAQGTLTQIFPNDIQKEGKVRAGQNIQIGGEESPFEYTVSGNGGLERIFVYAYPTSQSNSPMTVAMVQQKQGPFRAQEKMSMPEYVAMVRDSAVFTTRGIEVVPRKASTQKVSNSSELDQNKLELTLQVEK
jgi:hypothetical protein